MSCITLITSVINTPNSPLSYSNVRSVFTRQERFEQTKKTVQSIKENLPNSKIIIVECSDLNEEEKKFLDNNCDYILNLWEKKGLHGNIFGKSKSLGEGTITIEALKYINDKDIKYNYLYKISGRYWLNDNFKIDNIDNIEGNVFKRINNNEKKLLRINNNENNIFTALYKINEQTVDKLLKFLINNKKSMENCIDYEVLMSHFVKNIDKKIVDRIGLSGFVTVCGSKYNG